VQECHGRRHDVNGQRAIVVTRVDQQPQSASHEFSVLALIRDHEHASAVTRSHGTTGGTILQVVTSASMAKGQAIALRTDRQCRP
jgi:hypothetical protein